MPMTPISGGDDRVISQLDRLLEEIRSLVGDEQSPVAAIESERLSGMIAFLDHRPSLSPRELEILRLVARGLPNKAIATTLDISPHTVASHMRRMFAKLDVRSRAALVATTLSNDH
jgi:DNA-binding CsgD family transcriptional regulator